MDIEWIDFWKSETLKVVEIKKGDRSIYTMSNPLIDDGDAINIEGEELIALAEKLLEQKKSQINPRSIYTGNDMKEIDERFTLKPIEKGRRKERGKNVDYS